MKNLTLFSFVLCKQNSNIRHVLMHCLKLLLLRNHEDERIIDSLMLAIDLSVFVILSVSAYYNTTFAIVRSSISHLPVSSHGANSHTFVFSGLEPKQRYVSSVSSGMSQVTVLVRVPAPQVSLH